MDEERPAIDPDTLRDLERLRSSTERLDTLLGLHIVPPGFLLVCIGVANLTSGPASGLIIPVGVVVAAVAYVLVRRHYDRVVGSVEQPGDRREVLGAIALAGLIMGGAVLDVLGAPISMTLVGLAVAIASGRFLCGPHAMWLATASAMAAIATGSVFWDDSVAAGLSSIAMGLVMIAGGWLSHRRLDAALAPVG